MVLAFILYAAFASVFIIGKISLLYGSPIFAVGLRMLISGIILLGYLWVYDRKKLVIRKKDIKPLILLTVFNIYLTNVLEFWGLQYLVSAKASFLYNLTPFLTSFLSYIMLSEKVTYKKLISLIAGFLGFLPILLSESAPEEAAGHILGFLSWPEIALLGAAGATAIGWVALKSMVGRGFSPLAANGISMLLAGVMCMPTSYAFESWDPFPVSSWGPFIGWTALVTIIANLLCYNLYGFLLRKYSATMMSFLGFMTPFFTAILGWIFLGEVVTWKFYLSAVIVLSSLYLFYQEELKQGYVRK